MPRPVINRKKAAKRRGWARRRSRDLRNRGLCTQCARPRGDSPSTVLCRTCRTTRDLRRVLTRGDSVAKKHQRTPEQDAARRRAGARVFQGLDRTRPT